MGWFHSGMDAGRICYMPSAFARSALVYLQEIGELQAGQPHSSKQEKMDSYLFFQTLSGSGEVVYDGKAYPLHPGDCVFLDCRKPYVHRSGAPCRLRWIHFYGKSVDGIYGQYMGQGGRNCFHAVRQAAFDAVWEELYRMASSLGASGSLGTSGSLGSLGTSGSLGSLGTSGSLGSLGTSGSLGSLGTSGSLGSSGTSGSLGSLEPSGSLDASVRDMKMNQELNALLTLLMDESQSSGVGREVSQKRDMYPVKEYLDGHYGEKIILDVLADLFYINKYYLTRVFKEQFGVSISNYLLQVRLGHAKHLLRHSDEKVEVIGLKCGLGDLTYFSRTFKKAEGISPRAYRQNQ